MLSLRVAARRVSGVRALSQTAPAFQTVPASPFNDLTPAQALLPKQLVSGAPSSLITEREVRIYREAKPATQLANHNGDVWRLNWDVLGKANRWENDMMGYQGTSDALQCTNLKFDTKEAAVRFATSNGWTYYVQEPKVRRFRKKEYAVNFLHLRGPLRHIRTK